YFDILLSTEWSMTPLNGTPWLIHKGPKEISAAVRSGSLPLVSEANVLACGGSVTLRVQISQQACTPDVTFGCEPNAIIPSIWTSNGCLGKFFFRNLSGTLYTCSSKSSLCAKKRARSKSVCRCSRRSSQMNFSHFGSATQTRQQMGSLQNISLPLHGQEQNARNGISRAITLWDQRSMSQENVQSRFPWSGSVSRKGAVLHLNQFNKEIAQGNRRVYSFSPDCGVVELRSQMSFSPCEPNVSFGCEPTFSRPTAWVRNGCRARLTMGSLQCGGQSGLCRSVSASAMEFCPCLPSDFTVPTNAIAWFHPPKTFTSFGTALVHLANASLPDYVAMPDCSHKSWCFTSATENFSKVYPYKTYFNSIFWEKNGDFGAHSAVTKMVFEQFKGRFFGIFRDPVLRTFSAFSDKRLRDPTSDTGFGGLLAYARRLEGMVVKTLAGQEDGSHCHTRKSNCLRAIKPNLTKAMSRLEEFAFVGLAEEYDLSICLLHFMFGGRCLPVEFANNRPSTYLKSNLTSIATKFRRHYVDPIDTPLYEAASKRFWADVTRFNVSKTRCAARGCVATTRFYSAATRGAKGKIVDLADRVAALERESSSETGQTSGPARAPRLLVKELCISGPPIS
ncbi:MAG: hypothetical protein SGPRY_002681, partial [Prymnesium sp.]